MSIESYEFKDSDTYRASIKADGCISLADSDYDAGAIYIYKDDVIAMAKHFNLIDQ
jgi:UPF0288 family protein (methanogenesis marker protein 3)